MNNTLNKKQVQEQIKEIKLKIKELKEKRKINSGYKEHLSNQISFQEMKIEKLKKWGVRIYELPAKKFRIDLKAAMRLLLEEEKIASVLVEGGSVIHGEFLKAGLADEALIFIAPKIMGDGIPSVTGKLTEKVKDAVKLALISTKAIENDTLIHARVIR